MENKWAGGLPEAEICKAAYKGRHKWGQIRWTEPQREWIQNCRWCGALLIGRKTETNVLSQIVPAPTAKLNVTKLVPHDENG